MKKLLKKFCSVDIIDNFGYFNQREKSYIEISDMNIFIFGRSLLWVFCDNKVINCFEHTFDTEITKYLVTSKDTIGKLFEENYSDNLLEISIDRDDFYEVLPNDIYYGSQLNYSSEFESIIRKEDIEITSYKLQPQHSNSTITFYKENLIEFSFYSDYSEIRKNIVELSLIFNRI